jgi:hypothetical protein
MTAYGSQARLGAGALSRMQSAQDPFRKEGVCAAKDRLI